MAEPPENKDKSPDMTGASMAELREQVEAAAETPPGQGPGDGPAVAAPDPVSTAGKAAGSAAGSASWALAGVLLVLIAAGTSYLSWPMWSSSIPNWLRGTLAPVMEAGRSTAADKKIEALAKRVETVESDIGAIRKQVQARGAPDGLKPWAEVAALNKRLDGSDAEAARQRGDLVARIAALESRPGPAAAVATPVAGAEDSAALDVLRRDNRKLAEQVAVLARKLATVEALPRLGTASPAAGALMLSVGQLREVLRGTGAYAQELDMVRGLAGDDPELSKAIGILAPRAGSGIPNFAALSASFGAVAAEIARKALVPNGGGWVGRTLARLSRLIIVRRTGTKGAAGDGPTALAAKAEVRLAARDLAGAVKVLGRLEGAPARAAQGWIAAANARIGAEAALSSLTARAITALGGPGG